MSTESNREPRVASPATVGLALAVLLRLAWPLRSMPTHVDEGGWPLSVRQWATEGVVTYDFHTAPAYHVILGVVYSLATPSMFTARVFSTLLSLLSLWLLWWSARRLLEDDRAALWAALLWASCFPANDLAGRALIEPVQLVWLLALLAALVSTGRATVVTVAATTAGLLLTKANAVVLLPPLAAAVVWDKTPVVSARHARKLAGLGAGVLAACAVYVGLYLTDPATFSLGWGLTMEKAHEEAVTPLVRLGRFAIDPSMIERLVEFLGSQSPLLVAFGVAGALRAVLRRRALGVGLWIVVLLPFLLIQLLYSPHYFAILYPALAIAAAGLLAAALPGETGRLRWPALVVGLMVLDGLGRTAVAVVSLRASERTTVEWMRVNAGSGDVLGPPYVLMQLPNHGVSFFAFEDRRFVPDSAALSAFSWVVVDEREWAPRLRGLDPSADGETFARCCVPVHRDGAATVYRVRQTDER